MTPFEKFKETAALVNVWIREEQPKKKGLAVKIVSIFTEPLRVLTDSLRTDIVFVTVYRIGIHR